MSTSTPPVEQRSTRKRWPVFLGTIALLVIGFAAWRSSRGDATNAEPADAERTDAAAAADVPNDKTESLETGIVTLPRSAWEAAGLTIATASSAPLSESVRVTGSVSLNEDRVAHLFPLVEGRVDDVLVRFGQDVRAGEVLAVVQSKEVGERKLELVQARLSRQIAEVNFQRAEEVNRNAQALIAALKQGTAIEQIEAQFENRAMGGHRERLVTAYTSLAKASADYDRLDDLTSKGVTSAKELAAAKATRDAARAAYAAILDEIGFAAKQETLETNHALQEVAARVAAAEAFLAILGYSKEDLRDIDPAQEGEALSHYPVVAPFDGTILTKDATLLEAVGPERKLFEIGDLSTVWIVADIYDRHLPLVDGLQGRTVLVRSDVLPDRAIEATVFVTGATVDPQTRTARLRAVADNADRRLRPGMFVEVELPGLSTKEALLIPESALLNHAGEEFVFVQKGDETFERRDVTVGRRNDGSVEVLAGLDAGEPVVATGGFALKSRMLTDLLAGD